MEVSRPGGGEVGGWFREPERTVGVVGPGWSGEGSLELENMVVVWGKGKNTAASVVRVRRSSGERGGGRQRERSSESANPS